MDFSVGRQAETVENGGGNVFGTDQAVFGLSAKTVGGAMDDATANAATGQRN